jgi:D-glycero-alpha-D-manno-heptose-7-phosphate kinase
MKAALLAGELNDFGLLLHKGWEIKKRLSSKISNTRIDEMYESALRNGALGDKITGHLPGSRKSMFNCFEIAHGSWI